MAKKIIAKKKKVISQEDKKSYLEYFKKMRKERKQPMTLAHWNESGTSKTYYQGAKRTKPAAKMSRGDRKAIGMKD